MNCKLLFVLIFGLISTKQCLSGAFENVLTYQTDYTSDEMLRLLFRGVPLTYDRIFNGNDSYGPIEEEVTFWCMNKNTNKMIQTFVNDPDISLKINKTKPLYTAVHGWLDNKNRTWVGELVKDLVSNFDVNACAIDWGKLSNYEYSISAIQHVPIVGDYLANFIQYLVSLGFSYDSINMVGHSLGAQIIGQAGMRLGGKVASIYGLDPAGPLFCLPVLRDIENRLDSTDAKFVQIIHTTDGMLGCGADQGHQDFKPDSGLAPQTACILPIASQTLSPEIISCSHAHAVQYFRYSLNSSNIFTGRRCASTALFTVFGCNNNPTDVLGPFSNRIPGRFFLRTSFSAPFTTTT